MEHYDCEYCEEYLDQGKTRCGECGADLHIEPARAASSGSLSSAMVSDRERRMAEAKEKMQYLRDRIRALHKEIAALETEHAAAKHRYEAARGSDTNTNDRQNCRI